jgi:hypothetical protein
MSQLDAAANVTPARHERSYCLEGLPDREVLVFKSMVRLLGHRTACAWVYSPLSTELRVVADGLPATALHSALAQQVLTLGAGNVKRQSYLRLPLHANELEAELNRLGALIAPTNKTAAAALVADAAKPMRMLRWPPATVLTTTTRVRLATLMAGKPLAVGELQQRSKENLAVCTAFFDDLRQLNLLIPAVTLPAATTTHAESTDQRDPQQTKKIPVQPSLFERIRMRLGLQNSNTASQTSRA